MSKWLMYDPYIIMGAGSAIKSSNGSGRFEWSGYIEMGLFMLVLTCNGSAIRIYMYRITSNIYTWIYLPHPLKNPPDDAGGSVGAFEIGGNPSNELRFSVEDRPNPREDPPTIFRSESSFPFTSSSSCLATASAVFAFTSSRSSDSSPGGRLLSVASTFCKPRLLDRLLNAVLFLELFVDAERASLSSRRPPVFSPFSLVGEP